MVLSTLGHAVSEQCQRHTFNFNNFFEHPRVEIKDSLSNCEVYIPLFLETLLTIWKTFSQYGLIQFR